MWQRSEEGRDENFDIVYSLVQQSCCYGVQTDAQRSQESPACVLAMASVTQVSLELV